MSESFVVYILHSNKDGRLYIGQTNDLCRRLTRYNDPNGKTYTSKRGPWTLVHVERHPDRRSAMARERFLKSCAGAAEKKQLAAKGPVNVTDMKSDA